MLYEGRMLRQPGLNGAENSACALISLANKRYPRKLRRKFVPRSPGKGQGWSAIPATPHLTAQVHRNFCIAGLYC